MAHELPVLRRYKLVLTGLTGVFALAALYTTVLVFNYASVLRQSSPYNFAWAASQAVGEFARLEERVAAHALADGGTPLDEVRLRLDIVRNRVAVLRGGGMAEFITRFPDHGSVVERLSAALQGSASLLDRSGTDRSGTVRDITSGPSFPQSRPSSPASRRRRTSSAVSGPPTASSGCLPSTGFSRPWPAAWSCAASSSLPSSCSRTGRSGARTMA
jgi:hypothetical protein